MFNTKRFVASLSIATLAFGLSACSSNNDQSQPSQNKGVVEAVKEATLPGLVSSGNPYKMADDATFEHLKGNSTSPNGYKVYQLNEMQTNESNDGSLTYNLAKPGENVNTESSDKFNALGTISILDANASDFNLAEATKMVKQLHDEMAGESSKNDGCTIADEKKEQRSNKLGTWEFYSVLGKCKHDSGFFGYIINEKAGIAIKVETAGAIGGSDNAQEYYERSMQAAEVVADNITE